MCCFPPEQCWPCWACYCPRKSEADRQPNARVAGNRAPKSLNSDSSTYDMDSTTTSRRESQSSSSASRHRSPNGRRRIQGRETTAEDHLRQPRRQSWPAGKAAWAGSMGSSYRRATLTQATRLTSVSPRGRRIVVGSPADLVAAARKRDVPLVNMSSRKDKEAENKTQKSSSDTAEPDSPKPETPTPQTLPVEFSLCNLGALAAESLQDASSSVAPAPTIRKPVPKPDFTYPEDRPLPTTRKEHHQSLATHLRDTGLDSLISRRDPRPREIASIAATSASQICDGLQLSRYATPDLTKLGLYDIIVYCDDSGSMHSENRYGSLKTVVQRIARIASAYNSSGIKIRFMNADNDGNDITTEAGVDACLDAVQPSGWTPLGTKLFEKVVEPLIVQKAMKGELRAPAVISVVTDGQVFLYQSRACTAYR